MSREYPPYEVIRLRPDNPMAWSREHRDSARDQMADNRQFALFLDYRARCGCEGPTHLLLVYREPPGLLERWLLAWLRHRPERHCTI